MKTRRRALPAGWYPAAGDRTEKVIKGYLERMEVSSADAVSGVAPHAGWEFSGSVAAEVYANIHKNVHTVAVIGGHLPPGGDVLAAYENEYDTPLGTLDADKELLSQIQNRMPAGEDRFQDNTVEIQLPFVKFFFPKAKALWMRVSPSQKAAELGRVIREAADYLQKKVTVVGSTDLTHYGSNYGFTSHGSGEKALQWVKNVNDRRFIESIIHCNASEAIERSLHEHSACSAGGAVAACSFALSHGIDHGTLLSYSTSYDVYPSDSFVGYAGIIYQ